VPWYVGAYEIFSCPAAVRMKSKVIETRGTQWLTADFDSTLFPQIDCVA